MASTIGINLRVTGHCNQGGRKYMEDAFLVAYQQTEDEKDLEYAYFGIFDGHGGREAAQYAKDHLMNNIVNQKNFWSDCDELVLRSIREGFITTHMAMWKEVANWPKTMSGLPSTSGTTASIAFIRRGKMYTGHVGDSKIVLGSKYPESDNWFPRPLTNDHKPESPKERERIYSAGGCVMNKAGVERVVWYRPRLGHKGPVRRSTRVDRIPFLAVARSLGDLWSYNYTEGEFVVSPEPDVAVVTLDPKRDRCIVLASDGLWNMLSPQLAVSIVQETELANERLILESDQSAINKPASNPSKLLVDRALNRWYNLNMRADNTSVVTVLLDPPGPPKREVLLRQRVMQKLRPREEMLEVEPTVVYTDNESPTSDISNKRSSTNNQSAAVKPDEPSVTAMTPSANLAKDKKRPPNSSNIPGETMILKCPSLPKPVVLTPKRVVTKNPNSPSSPHSITTKTHHHKGVFQQRTDKESCPGPVAAIPSSRKDGEEAKEMCPDANCAHGRCEDFRKVMAYAAFCRQSTNTTTTKDASKHNNNEVVSTISNEGNENSSSILNEETDPASITNIKVLRSNKKDTTAGEIANAAGTTTVTQGIAKEEGGKRKWTESDGSNTAKEETTTTPASVTPATVASGVKQLKTNTWSDVSNCRVAATRSLSTRNRLRTSSKVKD